MEKREEYDKKRKTIATVLIILAVLIIVIMAITINKNRNNANKNQTGVQNNAQTTNQTKNYEVLDDGVKVNTSSSVATEKKVGDVTISDGKLSYEKGTSRLTAKVKNNGAKVENLKLNIKYIGNDGKVISESSGQIGSLEANEEKYLSADITEDVSNTKDVNFEIVK